MSRAENIINENQPHSGEPLNQDPQPASEIDDLKKQITELRKEAAKLRTNAKSVDSEKFTIKTELNNLKNDFNLAKKETQLVRREALLDKAGCLKPELLINTIPEDCDDVQAWIDDCKQKNGILFKKEANHGGGFKPSSCQNLSASEVMNSFIRKAAARTS